MSVVLKPQTTELLVVQPTTFCNIDCKYCYLPHRTRKDRMSLDTFRAILRNLKADDALVPGFELLWHSGEPLSAGREFFVEANAIVQEILPGVMGYQTFQTNAMLIDDAWCRFFKDIKATVGISLDGPQRFHDKNRVTRAGKGTFDAVIRGMETLRRHGVDFYVISVLDSESLQVPEEHLAFAEAHGIDRLCFNVEETDGLNVSNTLGKAETPLHARRFFDVVMSAMSRAGNRVWVREIADMMAFIEGSAQGSIESHVGVPFRIVTVDVNGRWTTFCPELMSTQSERYGDFRFGNLAETPISQGTDLAKFGKVFDEINRGIEACRNSCEYFGVCGGGRPANKYGEHRRFDVAETLQCQVTTKALADACVGAIDELLAKSATVSMPVPSAPPGWSR